MRNSRRPAYTLLEVLLAMAISLLLLGALYVAMDTQLRLAQDSRDKVEESQLARALLARIAGDISPGLRPALPPMSQGGSGGGGSGTSGASAPASGGTAGGTGSATSAGAASSSTSSAPMILLSSVQGDGSALNLITTRAPRELLALNGTPGGDPILSDQRVVSYWLAGASGDSSLGLARREVSLVTSDEAQLLAPDIPDEMNYVIAPEVKSLSFRYLDPQKNAWLDEGSRWPDDATGYDGSTPTGPPVAVEITLEIAKVRRSSRVKESVRKYRQVVFIPTANGVPASSSTSGSSSSSP